MADNFNLSKFIRNNPLLNESIGGYRDIKPMKEGSDEDLFIKVIPGILKNVNVYDMKRAFDKGEFDSALKSFKDKGEVSQEDMAISILHDYFAKKIGGSKPMEEIVFELEKPENIYADDENETYGRAFGLAGQQLKSAIDALRQDGFDDEDIKNFLMTGIDMYDQAFDGYDDLEEAEGLNEEEYTVDFGTNTMTYTLDRANNVLKGLKPGAVPGSARKEDLIPVTIGKDGYLSTTDRRVKDISPKSNKNPFSDPGYMNRD
jgi:hypothetical protein